MKALSSIFHNQKGLTLVELCVIIVIISVLVATVALRFNLLSDAAKTAACKANQAALTTALLTYQFDNGGMHAENIEDLAPYVKGEIIPECPSGGTYSIENDITVVCSLSEHERIE